MAERICPGCGEVVPPNTYQGNPRKWCSPACRAWSSRHPGQRRGDFRPCVVCGADISHRNGKALTCSQVCSSRRSTMKARTLSICELCASEFEGSSRETRFCSMSCAGKARQKRERQQVPPEVAAARQEKQLEKWRRKNRRRRGSVVSEPYTLAEIAERDGYRCGLCGRKVNMKLTAPRRNAPTIDHIVPLSISKDDTRLNVHLAHFSCNVQKGARGGGEQLALVG